MSLRVLHLIDSGGLYGAEQMLLGLVAAQLRSGLCPLILSAGTPDCGDKPLEAEARRRGLPVHEFRMRAGLNFGKGLEILRFARHGEFDILHSHGYKFNVLLGLLPRCLRAQPLLSTVHGYVLADRCSKMRINQWADRRSLARMDAVVFVSRQTQINAGLQLPNAAVIANGIDTQACAAEDSTTDAVAVDAAFGRHRPVIGAFGRLANEKGFEHLITAFVRVHAACPDALLVIWGEGYLRPRLEALIRRHALEGRVLMPGYTRDVARLLRRLDVLALPSLTEGLPIILLEAMLQGTPVVASAVGSVPEVLDQGRCGRLVTPADVRQLADALLEAVNDPAGDARLTAAGERVRSVYSADAMAGQYRTLYQRLLAGERPDD